MTTALDRKGKNLLAKVAVRKGACAFCCREVDEELTFGKLYEIGDIYCHYFCVLLSCCLMQKGQDNEGLFGFLYPDILAEIARSKKHKCSYCGHEGASLGCSVAKCKKQFHLPCGRERNAVSLFYGNYKSFCQKHAPKQKISDTVMAKVKIRTSKKRLQNLNKGLNGMTKQCVNDDDDELTCMICYEAVDGYPTLKTFWPPCCGRDAWFHRSCLERMALSAGVHYLKCPLCNDKERFYEAVLQQGVYVPDRDAAWELEQNAFSEIYERTLTCGIEQCLCPNGRDHDSDSGPWDINVCVLCGSASAHARCRGMELGAGPDNAPYVCGPCAPAAEPQLVQALHELSVQEARQGAERAARERVVRPVMPSRMSLRRTKPAAGPSSSSNKDNKTANDKDKYTEMCRMELNLKPPRKNVMVPAVCRNIENKLLSPIKLLEQGLYERISKMDLDTVQMNMEAVIEKMREKLRRPQPLGIKKKIINNILEDLVTSIYKDNFKTKEPLREWISPKKCADVKQERKENPNLQMKSTNNVKTNEMDTKCEDKTTFDSPKLKTIQIDTDSMEISEDNNAVNIDLVSVEDARDDDMIESNKTHSIKLIFIDKEQLNKTNIDIDIESFKSQYLNEVLCHDDSIKAHVKCNNDCEPKLDEKQVNNVTKKQMRWKDRRRHKKKKNKLIIKLKLKKDNVKAKKNAKIKKKLKDSPKAFKQYVLKYYDNKGNKQNNVIAKPQKDVKLKRKYVRKEKSSDNLKQTSLDKFFLLHHK